LNQALRERTINRLKDGLVDIVVATDVAARGLDVDRITHVLNYDIPYDTESYVHRIGRTGRAGREGNAILFVTPRERSMLMSIERATRQPIKPMELPTSAQIQDKRVKEFKENLTKLLESAEDMEKYNLLVERWSEEDSIPMAELAAGLLYIAQKPSPLFEEIRELPKPFERPDRNDRFDRGDRPDRGPRFERNDFAPRADRGDRPERPRRDRDESDPHKAEEGYDRFYIGVGREHRINAGDIVGAIANESGLPSKDIGRIKLFPFFSTVELPQGVPPDVMEILRAMTIRGNPSKFRLMTDEPPSGGDRGPRGNDDRGPRRPPFGGGDRFNRDDSSSNNQRDDRGNFPARRGGGFGGGEKRSFGGPKGPRGGGFGGRGK